MVYMFRQINKIYEARNRKMVDQELKRIYRCPNCDAMVLEKVTYNYNHFCSCGVITHSNNLKIEYEVA